MICDEIYNIAICYGNEDEVCAYANQLARQSIADQIHLAVVINKVKRGVDYLEDKLSNIGIAYEIQSPEDNLGYLNGLVYGYSKSEITGGWVIFSNTDIKLEDKDLIKRFMESDYYLDKEVWGVGPSVFAPLKGTYSNPYLQTRPSRKSYILKNIGMLFPRLYHFLFFIKSKVKKNQRKELKTEKREVYAIHGSFMFLRTELLDILKDKDKWELLYDEEQYIAEISRMNGKKVVYDPDLQGHHMEGTSTGKVNIKKRFQMMRKANKRILREFY